MCKAGFALRRGRPKERDVSWRHFKRCFGNCIHLIGKVRKTSCSILKPELKSQMLARKLPNPSKEKKQCRNVTKDQTGT